MAGNAYELRLIPFVRFLLTLIILPKGKGDNWLIL